MSRLKFLIATSLLYPSLVWSFGVSPSFADEKISKDPATTQSVTKDGDTAATEKCCENTTSMGSEIMVQTKNLTENRRTVLDALHPDTNKADKQNGAVK